MHKCLVYVSGTHKCQEIPSSFSYDCLWDAMWVVGIIPRSSTRVTSDLNHGTISPVPLFSCKKNKFMSFIDPIICLHSKCVTWRTHAALHAIFKWWHFLVTDSVFHHVTFICNNFLETPNTIFWRLLFIRSILSQMIIY